MKILRFILGIIGLFILGLVIVGLIGPEMKIETSTAINKPASDVYAVMMDESKLQDWMSSYKGYELVSGTKNEVGAKSKLIFEENGEEMEMIETITAVEPGKRLAFDFTNDLMDGSVDMNLHAANGGTDLKTKTVFKGKTFMFKAMLPLFKGSMKEQMESDYNKLKKVIEAS